MATDLFKIYKASLQRYKRNPECPYHEEMHSIIKSIVQGAHDDELALELAYVFDEFERSAPRGVRHYLAPTLIEALKSGEYEINVPHPVLHRWNENNSSQGRVYLAVSPSKPGQVKLGATTMDIKKRFQLYEDKYGYEITLHHEWLLSRPFSAESEAKRHLAASLVSGLTYGDSNEWYQIDARKAKKRLQQLFAGWAAPDK